MFQLFVDKDSYFAPEMEGEYQSLEEAQEAAKKVKSEDSDAYYEIRETNGGFNNYGELRTVVVEKG